jgi:predicted kinase
MAGLPGTGKSTVAAEIAKRTGAAVLSKDTVRHALFPPELIEYSTTQDDFVVEVLLLTAVYLWSIHPNKTIILDGRTFSRASQRRHVIEFAERARQRCRMVECLCAEEVAKQRLGVGAAGHPAGNRTPALYDEVKAQWEPIGEERVRVRTDEAVDVDAVVNGLFS